MATDMQEILVYVFGPWVGWFLVGLIAGAIIIGVYEFILSLLRSLTGR